MREEWHGKEKEEEEEYCHIPVFGGQRVGKMTKEFPAALFLLSASVSFFLSFFFPKFHAVSLSVIFSPSPLVPFFFLPRLFCFDNVFLRLHISLSHFGSVLFTHDVCESGSFPFQIWQREETLVPSHALIFCVD